MKRFRMIAGAALVCVIAVAGSACGALPGEMQEETRETPACMESTPVVDYMVPSLTPNILVDQNGYQAQGKKTAVIKCAELPESFRLIECETGETVYMGSVEEDVYSTELGLYTGYADFGDYPGIPGEQYYIECDYIGRSYPFSISETEYRDTFNELYQEICDRCRSGEVPIDDVLALLIAYERYGDIFPDEDGDEVPDVMKTLQEWSTALDHTQVDVGQASLYAAALAKFSYLYQNYDWEFANRCLKAADRAYRYAGKYPEDVSPEEYFYAAAELYRATGNYGYHNVIKNYLLENPVADMQNDFIFWGCVTYLSTKQKVDMNLCKDMIKVLMLEGEKISYAAKNSKFLVIMDEKSSGSAELLKDITRLVVVDHIITNHEYATVLQNHLHYMLGRNPQSISYLDSAGTRNYKEIDEKYGIMNQVELNAELILMMSSIMDELRPEEDLQP